MTTLPASTLCRVVIAAEQIFSDGSVKEAIQDARRALEDAPSIGTALAAFSEHIAPVLLGDAHRPHTIALLQELGKDASCGPGTIRDLFNLVLMDEDFSVLLSILRVHGRARLLSAIYRYGVPSAMPLLAAYLECEEARNGWEIYVADMSAALVRALYKDAQIKNYSSLIKTHQSNFDTRSGHDILVSVREKLKKRKEKRKYEDHRNDNQ